MSAPALARSSASRGRSFRGWWEGGAGVLVGALQSERVEETRDRAERGSAVRGSDQASVAPKRIPSPTPRRDADRSEILLRQHRAVGRDYRCVVAAGRLDGAPLGRVVDVHDAEALGVAER